MRLNEKNVIFFSTCNSPVDKEGYLQKKGEINKGFQKRWFLLKGNLLYYFEKKGDREPIGLIVLEGCTVELAELYTETYTFQIKFQGPGSRVYHLTADSQAIMEDWMKAIACASYEYMKLMVSELQRQLDEITASEHANLMANSNASNSASIGPLVDFNTTTAASNTSQPGKRFNPFNTSQTEELDAFGAPKFAPPPRPPPPKLDIVNKTTNSTILKEGGKPRNFQELHEYYGAMIDLSISQKTEKNLLSP